MVPETSVPDEEGQWYGNGESPEQQLSRTNKIKRVEYTLASILKKENYNNGNSYTFLFY